MGELSARGFYRYEVGVEFLFDAEGFRDEPAGGDGSHVADWIKIG